MRMSIVCPKCDSNTVISIPYSAMSGDGNRISLTGGFKTIPIERMVCVTCGFTEEWIKKDKDLDYLSKKFKPLSKDDYV